MRKYVYFSMLFMFFTIFAIRLSIILSNKSFYEEKLEESTEFKSLEKLLSKN